VHSSPCEIIVSPALNSTIFLAGNAAEKNGGASRKARPLDFIDLLVSALPPASFVGHTTVNQSGSNFPFMIAPSSTCGYALRLFKIEQTASFVLVTFAA
jgi:hypothetical protein